MKFATGPTRIAAALLAASFIAFAHDADAAGEVVPELRVTADTNDNPRLRPNDGTDLPRAASRLVAEAGVRLTSFSPQGEFEFEPVMRTDAYGSATNDELESTDVFLHGRWQHRWRRATVGLRADASREKLLGAEVLDTPPGTAVTPVDIDGALLGLNEIRTRGVFAPYTEVQFNERSTARLDLRAMDVSYDAPAALVNRTNFTNLEAGAAYVRKLTSRDTLSTRVFGGQFLADANDNETDTTGIEMEFARDVTDLWSFNTTWGIETSDFGYVDSNELRVHGSHDDFVFGVGVGKQPRGAPSI